MFGSARAYETAWARKWRESFRCFFRLNYRRDRHLPSLRIRNPLLFRPARFALCAVASAAFSFKEYGIPDEEVKDPESDGEFDESRLLQEGWEMLYEENNLHVYRRRRKTGLKYETYEYRCQGSYFDISPRYFLDAQNDVAYRAEWDANVIKLEMLEDDGHNQQLIRWVARYPYPLYPREYVYVRRSVVGNDRRHVVMESRALPQSVVPVSGNFVRVVMYESRMCVRCHSDMDSPGLDYVLTYYDNPEANIPTYAYNWIVNQAGPYFIKQVHKEALKLARSGRKVGPTIKMTPPSLPVNQDECENYPDGTCEESSREESKEKKTASAPSLPGTRLRPSGNTKEQPARRGEEREVEEEEAEKEDDTNEDEWDIVDPDECVEEEGPASHIPGRRILT